MRHYVIVSDMGEFLGQPLADAPADCQNAALCTDFVAEADAGIRQRQTEVGLLERRYTPMDMAARSLLGHGDAPSDEAVANFAQTMDGSAPVPRARRCAGCVVGYALQTLTY